MPREVRCNFLWPTSGLNAPGTRPWLVEWSTPNVQKEWMALHGTSTKHNNELESLEVMFTMLVSLTIVYHSPAPSSCYSFMVRGVIVTSSLPHKGRYMVNTIKYLENPEVLVWTLFCMVLYSLSQYWNRIETLMFKHSNLRFWIFHMDRFGLGRSVAPLRVASFCEGHPCLTGSGFGYFTWTDSAWVGALLHWGLHHFARVIPVWSLELSENREINGNYIEYTPNLHPFQHAKCFIEPVKSWSFPFFSAKFAAPNTRLFPNSVGSETHSPRSLGPME